MATVADPIREHASRYAREALGRNDRKQEQFEILDEHVERYRSTIKQRAFLEAALAALDAMLEAHIVQHHGGDHRADCGRKNDHRKAKLMVEDRLDAIKERQDPLRGMRN